MSNPAKTILWFIVIIIVIGGIWYGASREPKEEGIVKIGIVSHLSGDFASYGIPMKNAVQLAIEQMNEQDGINGKKIELVIEDDNSDSDAAATAMNKLVNIDKVSYVISAQGSGMTAVVSPIAQNNKKVLMITLGSAPGLTEVGDYVFRSIVSDTYQGIKMNEFLKTGLESKKVAGLYVNDAYGVGIKEIVNTNKNIEIVANEMFESGASDFKSQLTKIKGKNPDTLVLVAHKNEYPLILKQMQELNLDIEIVASETFKDQEILAESGSTAEGVYTLFMVEPKDYVNLINNYKQRFNEEPSAYSKYGYDGVMALMKAIQKVGDDSEKVKENLAQLEFNGASGKVSFDETGERIGIDYEVYVVKNGQFVPYGE